MQQMEVTTGIHLLQDMGQKALGLSRGMNGSSDVHALLKSSIVETWSINTSSPTSTWWWTTSSGVPSGAGRWW